MGIIKLENITKKYNDDTLIFEDANLEIDKGTITMITGKSGQGKTTILNIICGIDQNFTGNVYLDNDLGVTKNLRYKFNFILQNYGLVENETVFYNLNMVLEYEKLSKKERKKIINNALNKVGLEEKGKQMVYSLSGGEKQRVAIAGCLMKKNEIILADEPTGNLDDENTNIIMNLLTEFRSEGKTIIMVTHNMKLLRYADKVYELKNKNLKEKINN